jgi:hypothetical protein
MTSKKKRQRGPRPGCGIALGLAAGHSIGALRAGLLLGPNECKPYAAAGNFTGGLTLRGYFRDGPGSSGLPGDVPFLRWRVNPLAGREIH